MLRSCLDRFAFAKKLCSGTVPACILYTNGKKKMRTRAELYLSWIWLGYALCNLLDMSDPWSQYIERIHECVRKRIACIV